MYNINFRRVTNGELSHYQYEDLKELRICEDQEIIDLLENKIYLYKELLDSKVALEMLDYKKLETIIQGLEYSKKLLTGEYLEIWYKKKKFDVIFKFFYI